MDKHNPESIIFDAKNHLFPIQNYNSSYKGSVCRIQIDVDKMNFGRESLYDMDIKPEKSKKKN